MFRSIVVATACILFAGHLYAEDPKAAADKKPEAQATTAAKEGAAAKTDSAPAARRKGKGMRGEGIRGRVSKASLENGVLKLSLDGKEYSIAVGEKTHAVVRTAEKDGKEEIVGLMLVNGEHRQRARATGGKKRARTTAKS